MKLNACFYAAILAVFCVEITHSQEDTDACVSYGKMTCYRVFTVTETFQDCSLVKRKRRQINWGGDPPTTCPISVRIVEKKSKIYERVVDTQSGLFHSMSYPSTTKHDKVVCRVKVCAPSIGDRFRVRVTKMHMHPKRCFGEICIFLKGRFKMCCYNNDCDRIFFPTDTRDHRLRLEITHRVENSSRPCEGGLEGYYVRYNFENPLPSMPVASMTIDKNTGEQNLTCPCLNEASFHKQNVAFVPESLPTTTPTPTPSTEPVESTASTAAQVEENSPELNLETSGQRRRRRISSYQSVVDKQRKLAEFLCRFYRISCLPQPAPPALTTSPPLSTVFPTTKAPPTSCPAISCSATAVDDPSESDFLDDFAQCDRSLALDVVDGPFVRYVFNGTSGDCEEIKTVDADKCDNSEPAANCFQSLMSCQRKCTNVCLLKPSPGVGSKDEVRFFYYKEENRCAMFLYNGSGGTANNFKTELECQKECGLVDLGVDGIKNCIGHQLSATSKCRDDPKLKCLLERMMLCSTKT